MASLLRAAATAAASAVLLFVAPAVAQAAPPTCPDGSFTTLPGQRVALAPSPPQPGNPCTDPDGDDYTIAPADFPAHGTLSIDGASSYYTPNPGFHGRDEFTYTATDTAAIPEESLPATISILVDTPPACTDSSATVQSGGRLAVPLSCDDADGDDLDIFLEDPGHGTLDFTANPPVYTPAPGYSGPDAIDYDAEDPFGLGSQVGTLSITVTAPPPPPVITPPKDTTAPVFTLLSRSTKLKRALKNGVRVVVSSNEGGTARVTLSVDRATARKLKLKRHPAGPVKVGRLKTIVPSGKSTLAVNLTTKARKALKRARKVKLLVTAVMADASGNRSTRAMKVRLKR
jgi:hypothetical protein